MKCAIGCRVQWPCLGLVPSLTNRVCAATKHIVSHPRTRHQPRQFASISAAISHQRRTPRPSRWMPKRTVFNLVGGMNTTASQQLPNEKDMSEWNETPRGVSLTKFHWRLTFRSLIMPGTSGHVLGQALYLSGLSLSFALPILGAVLAVCLG
ncbi:hypothetical protein B0T24DRAFT_387754 [Lasiosphaeria ovina]|uniref:Uncharacterized protein n=1 Tax=Lasiosphaeria ovina TaxID=92902 RepID=A0AAE0K0D0_9PEZI|nr:hypothetical protein B0T24DRAFT_387754 [Lasiosphaeria ovina]